MGKHIFDSGNNITYENNQKVAENRAKLIDFCGELKLIIANTIYEKTNNKLATCKKPGTNPPYTFTRPAFDTVDYWLIPHRWKNAMTDSESDTGVNANSDHFPVILKSRVRLKATKPKQQKRNTKYDKCSK